MCPFSSSALFPASLLSRHDLNEECKGLCSHALHGFPTFVSVLLAGAAGVAGRVPRRWERKRLLMDAIRLKPNRTRRTKLMRSQAFPVTPVS